MEADVRRLSVVFTKPFPTTSPQPIQIVILFFGTMLVSDRNEREVSGWKKKRSMDKKWCTLTERKVVGLSLVLGQPVKQRKW